MPNEGANSSIETQTYTGPVSGRVDYDIIPDEVVRITSGSSAVAGYSEKPIQERPMFTDSVEPRERYELLRRVLGIREN
ncbi:hypothetical protein J4422_04415 [Candidatus Pacearchaeota archaeon]|nr:hypothetical protein [Candidatus Pacearchaeota archaeon]